MANVDRPNGFKPVSTLSGAPWNGAYRKFFTDTNCFLGDIMIADAASIADGSGAYQGVTRATSGTASINIGVVVGWEVDPDNTELLYHAGSGTFAVYLAVDPMIIYEGQGDGTSTILTATDVGMNVDFVITAGVTGTGVSNMEVLDGSESVDADTPLKLIGMVDRPDNEIGTANHKLLVQLNMTVFGTGVGNAGV